jgi:hypothetical protein
MEGCVMQPTKICPRCSTPASLSVQVCPSCGHRFRTQFVTPADPVQFKPTQMMQVQTSPWLPAAPTTLRYKRPVLVLMTVLIGLFVFGALATQARDSKIARALLGEWEYELSAMSDEGTMYDRTGRLYFTAAGELTYGDPTNPSGDDKHFAWRVESGRLLIRDLPPNAPETAFDCYVGDAPATIRINIVKTKRDPARGQHFMLVLYNPRLDRHPPIRSVSPPITNEHEVGTPSAGLPGD